ncbi:hypothetical protein HK098_003868 [Nowakowskiella sp. JEL0407]|nr:hypothetical protein HK098_003868 [Nowakowskiella sp. JEL0407]
MTNASDNNSSEILTSKELLNSNWTVNPTLLAIAGVGAGFFSAIITCPLDVVKVRKQNQKLQFDTPNSISQKIPGTLTSLKLIYHAEGIKGLYRGLGATLAGYLPTWAIYFTVYEWAKVRVSKELGKKETDSLIHLISAMLAGSLSTAATNPLWVIRTRIMTQPAVPTPTTPYHYTSTINAFSTIIKSEGAVALYKGLGPSLLGVTHVAIQFPLYEKLKQGLIERSDLDHHSSLFGLDILIASTVSKMIAGVVTYPHEVIRTRLQTQIYGVSKQRYSGIIQTANIILSEGGVKGMYRGLGTNLIRTVPSSAVTLLSYEFIKKYLEQWQ